MNKKAVCTIIAKNYLAFALTLGKSFLKFNPSIPFHILIVDADKTANDLPEIEGINYNFPLNFLDQDHLNKLAYGYDITEFCTAIKAFYLEYLLKQDYEQILYLDPDILILQSLDEIFNKLENNNIILIPHLLDPIPLDEYSPSEILILQTGTYNLGFIGIKASLETNRFLSWWQERLEKYCLMDFNQGLFVDQKWINLVPHLFQNVEVLKHRGYNVAYWNLNARKITKKDNVYYCDNELLVFFHFSAFNPANPTNLSKWNNRLNALDFPDLLDLLQYYANLVLANNHEEYKTIPYGYLQFSNGVKIDSKANALFRKALENGLQFTNPSDVNANPSFFKWMNNQLRIEKFKRSIPVRIIRKLKASLNL